MPSYRARYFREGVQQLLHDALGATLVGGSEEVDSAMDKLMPTLSETSRRAVELVYGLRDGTMRNMTEAGKLYVGPGEERVYRHNFPNIHTLLQQGIKESGIDPKSIASAQLQLTIRYVQPGKKGVRGGMISAHKQRALQLLRDPSRKLLLAGITQYTESEDESPSNM